VRLSHAFALSRFAVGVLGGCNAVLLQGNRRLCQQPSVDGCAGFHRDQSLGEDNSLNVRSGSKHHFAGNLPEYVLGLCVSAQNTLRRGSRVENCLLGSGTGLNQQRTRRHTERLRNVAYHLDRRVLLPTLDPTEVSHVDPTLGRERFLT